jgi:hypothetical protein
MNNVYGVEALQQVVYLPITEMVRQKLIKKILKVWTY